MKWILYQIETLTPLRAMEKLLIVLCGNDRFALIFANYTRRAQDFQGDNVDKNFRTTCEEFNHGSTRKIRACHWKKFNTFLKKLENGGKNRMSDMLLLFTIGPEQSYIEQARKSQDLYAGSMILSHLCRTAITASKLPPEQIIFPKNSQSNREQSLPNRFTAIVRETDIVEQPGETLEARLKAFGESIEKAVKDTFMAIANTVSTPFQDQCPHGFMEQVQGYLNIHWLFLPCTEKEYAAIYPRLERLLKGVKQVHAFALEPEKGRKCSICGERNVKVYRKNEQEKKHSTEELAARKLFSSDVLVVDEKDFRLIQEKFLPTRRGICAVCLHE